MNLLARCLYYAYALLLLAIGAAGMLLTRFELTQIFNVDLTAMGTQPAATFLNQYAYLKSLEFSFGLFCWFFRHRILAGEPPRFIFLAGIFIGVASRVLSTIEYGTPHWAFLVFGVLEFACGTLVFVYPQTQRSAL